MSPALCFHKPAFKRHLNFLSACDPLHIPTPPSLWPPPAVLISLPLPVHLFISYNSIPNAILFTTTWRVIFQILSDFDAVNSSNLLLLQNNMPTTSGCPLSAVYNASKHKSLPAFPPSQPPPSSSSSPSATVIANCVKVSNREVRGERLWQNSAHCSWSGSTVLITVCRF